MAITKCFTALLAFSLLAPMPAAAAVPHDICVQPPPAAKVTDVASGQDEQPNGIQVRWASVTYVLSTGHEAEVYVEVDGRGRGEGYIYVEGDPIVHVSYDTDARGGTTSWTAPDIDLPQQALAELAQSDVAEELFSGLGGPQETKCSEFGKGAVKVTKYLWIGLVAAAGVACCGATTGGCPACVGAATVAGAVGNDIADGYCD